MSRTPSGPTGAPRRRALVNLALLVAIVAVFVVALAVGISRGQFGGTDAQATSEIARSDPGYEPWFDGFWTQPGGEVESGLFALQAALGAGVLGFALGTYRERRQRPTVSAATAGAPPVED